jgi:hypothetical protein
MHVAGFQTEKVVMSDAAPRKVCHACGKDVAAVKRVKDSHGRYLCMPCNDAAIRTAQAAHAPAVVATAAAATVTVPSVEHAAPAPSDDDCYDILPSVNAGEAAASDPDNLASKPLVLPRICPNCEAPVLLNRRICLRCNHDLTKMDELILRKAAAAYGPSREEIIGTWISRGILAGLVLVVIGVVIFLGMGLRTIFNPGSAFDDFPTTRVQAINDFFTCVSKGQYDDAFYLVSFRRRATTNSDEIENYKRLFARMHQDLNKTHGDKWISRLKVESFGNPDALGEVAGHAVMIDDAIYFVSTEVQIPLDQVLANRTTRHPPAYIENGKHHFGVVEVAQYPLDPVDEGPGPPAIQLQLPEDQGNLD